MGDVKARVSTPHGQTIGYFVNPTVENLCGQDFEIKGKFVNEEGQLYEKVEFNPQVMPYVIDLSELGMPGLKRLENGYIQRGRQPVCMTAVKK